MSENVLIVPKKALNSPKDAVVQPKSNTRVRKKGSKGLKIHYHGSKTTFMWSKIALRLQKCVELTNNVILSSKNVQIEPESNSQGTEIIKRVPKRTSWV